MDGWSPDWPRYVRFSRPVHIVGVWSTPVLVVMHWPGAVLEANAKANYLFSHCRKSLSFVGFLDRRRRQGADDYRRIQIGQRLRVFLPALSWDDIDIRMLEWAGSQFPRIPLFPPRTIHTTTRIPNTKYNDTNETYITKRPTKGTTLIILDGAKRAKKRNWERPGTKSSSFLHSCTAHIEIRVFIITLNEADK